MNRIVVAIGSTVYAYIIERVSQYLMIKAMKYKPCLVYEPHYHNYCETTKNVHCCSDVPNINEITFNNIMCVQKRVNAEPRNKVET